MKKRLFFLFISFFCISMLSYAIDGWIRINQLGYLPNTSKKAIFISESPVQINDFTIYDALTNEPVETFSTLTNTETYESFKSTYVLDFSSFKLQGAFYIKAGLVYSPIIYINKNAYLGSADFLLKYLREQRFNNKSAAAIFTDKDDKANEKPKPKVLAAPTTPPKTNGALAVKPPTIAKTTTPALGAKPGTTATSKTPLTLVTTKPVDNIQPVQAKKNILVSGGWKDPGTGNQYSAITANIVYNMLLAYQLCPGSFDDKYDSDGNNIPNNIPDILDEAKHGLEWLISTYPSPDTLYFQLAPIPGTVSERNLFPAFKSNKPTTTTGYLTGLASVAGKYSSALGLGAEIFNPFDAAFSDLLKQKALQAFLLGQKNPGVCRTRQTKSAATMEEDNWNDDMELAASQLYRLTYDGQYLTNAAAYGRKEPVSPWMCSDTTKHYQWFPFFNAGHYQLATVENPRYKKEFGDNMLNGIQRLKTNASANPFNIGVPMVRNSNNLAVAMATQCNLYANITGDSTFKELENSVIDWIFGINPWGITMVRDLPYWVRFDNYSGPKDSQAGALINGPVMKSTYLTVAGHMPTSDPLERFQTEAAVINIDRTDSETNLPTLDGTAALAYLLAKKQQAGVPGKTFDPNQYAYGGIVRTNPKQKNISLVFTGHDMTDGYKTIRKTLEKQHVKASFFFTGDFFRRGRYSGIIKSLIKDGHYVGANSDKNLVYCSWRNRDSVLINKTGFIDDLRNNYAAMTKFGIRRDETPFFVAPYDNYNDSISLWCHEVGLHLVSATPGTLSYTDNSTPEMREKYFSSNEILNKITQIEKNSGLNGYILMFHLGADRRRQDKFYPQLITLIMELKKAGYQFTDLYQATDVVDKYKADLQQLKNKQKRKN